MAGHSTLPLRLCSLTRIPDSPPYANVRLAVGYAARADAFAALVQRYQRMAFGVRYAAFVGWLWDLANEAICSQQLRAGFVYDQENGLRRLNDLVDSASGSWIEDAGGINNHQIAATGVNSGKRHALLLEPTQERRKVTAEQCWGALIVKASRCL
jgi:hypothetical protein